MTHNILKIVLIAIVLYSSSCSTSTKSESLGFPSGWLIGWDKSQSYEMGTDRGAGQEGKNSATIKSNEKEIDGFGTLWQNCLPDKYLGKRVKMTGFLKSENVKGWAGLWLRVDCDTTTASFDNMHDGKNNRSIKGTTNWTKCEIILDVPNNSTMFSFGALLYGTGQVWFDNINFEIVDNSVETTGRTFKSTNDNFQPQASLKEKGVKTEPFNLSFEEN